tara:strand:- start:79 stop:561 length:483 start_codon:yes stop_codon:yes gene_type:complete
MTGYNYHAGMSNRAVAAYNSGIKPLSKITAEDLRRAGWTETKTKAVALAKSGFWRPCEWHHSGGTWYNRVDFYDAADLVNDWECLTTTARVDEIAKCQTAPPKTGERVRGEYVIWGVYRRRPCIISVEKFTGIKIGDWITLDSGGRKKATGNHIEWELAQ